MLESLCVFPTSSVALVTDITILFPPQSMPFFFFFLTFLLLKMYKEQEIV